MAIWKAQRTLLIVGEGYHEEAFLSYVKKLYAPRGCGLSVTIKNARGKGAQHVIEWTIRQIANTDYDMAAALLDTDTDWSEAIAKRAKIKKIQVLKSEPCFEALMLRLLDINPVGDAKALKKQFAPFVNHDATQCDHYKIHFTEARLQTGRANEAAIDALLKLMGV